MPVSIPFPVTWYEIKEWGQLGWRIESPRNTFLSHDQIFNGSIVIVKNRRGLLEAPLAVRVLSVVLASCISQYFRQYEVFEVAGDTSRLLAESCKVP